MRLGDTTSSRPQKLLLKVAIPSLSTDVRSKSMVFDSNVIVEEAIEMIKTKFKDQSETKYGLFLPPPLGFWCDAKRTLGFYKLKTNDVVELCEKISGKGNSVHEQLIVTSFPEERFVRNVMLDSEVSVRDLVEVLVESVNKNRPGTPVRNYEDFHFIIPPVTGSKEVILDNERMVLSYNLHLLKRGLILTRLFVSFAVKFNDGSIRNFSLDPDVTTQQAIRHILTFRGEGERNYGLYIPSGKSSRKNYAGLQLAKGRKILSYRLTKKDILQFRPVVPFSSDQITPASADDLFIVIYSKAHGTSSTLRLNAAHSTVGAAKVGFLKKNPVSNPSDYALYLARNPDVELDEGKLISDYSVANMEKILFDQNTSVKRAMRSDSSITAESRVFGVDPCLISTERDPWNELVVPRCLIDLKKCLILKDGLKKEGIFRLAGHGAKMEQLKDEMNSGNLPNYSSYDVHTIASLIKSWYDSLPKRIFSFLPSDSLVNCSKDLSLASSIGDHLPSPYISLFEWLMDLMVETARMESINKMATKNLAIVVSPPLLDFEIENPILGLQLSGRCSSVIDALLRDRIQSRESTIFGGTKEERRQSRSLPTNMKPLVVRPSSKLFPTGVNFSGGGEGGPIPPPRRKPKLPVKSSSSKKVSSTSHETHISPSLSHSVVSQSSIAPPPPKKRGSKAEAIAKAKARKALQLSERGGTTTTCDKRVEVSSPPLIPHATQNEEWPQYPLQIDNTTIVSTINEIKDKEGKNQTIAKTSTTSGGWGKAVPKDSTFSRRDE